MAAFPRAYTSCVLSFFFFSSFSQPSISLYFIDSERVREREPFVGQVPGAGWEWLSGFFFPWSLFWSPAAFCFCIVHGLGKWGQVRDCFAFLVVRWEDHSSRKPNYLRAVGWSMRRVFFSLSVSLPLLTGIFNCFSFAVLRLVCFFSFFSFFPFFSFFFFFPFFLFFSFFLLASSLRLGYLVRYILFCFFSTAFLRFLFDPSVLLPVLDTGRI